jgi:hypothetical protein
MILINGSKGIGTGFSTNILSYNPRDIIQYLINKISGEPTQETFIPYYDGFTGSITKVNESKFLVKGKYEEIGIDKIKITEDAIYREGIYETEFSRSNLQKKLWLIECIIAKEITKEKYLLDLKQNKIILDFSLKTLELKRSNKEKRKIKKIYFLYQNHFLNFHPEKQEIKSPLPNQRYRWVNPYSS